MGTNLGNHGKKTTFGDSVAKWRVFTAQLNKRAKKQASEPEAADANPPRCLGKADAWDMTHWPLAAAVQTIAASDGAKVRAALEKGMPTCVAGVYEYTDPRPTRAPPASTEQWRGRRTHQRES